MWDWVDWVLLTVETLMVCGGVRVVLVFRFGLDLQLEIWYSDEGMF